MRAPDSSQVSFVLETTFSDYLPTPEILCSPLVVADLFLFSGTMLRGPVPRLHGNKAGCIFLEGTRIRVFIPGRWEGMATVGQIQLQCHPRPVYSLASCRWDSWRWAKSKLSSGSLSIVVREALPCAPRQKRVASAAEAQKAYSYFWWTSSGRSVQTSGPRHGGALPLADIPAWIRILNDQTSSLSICDLRGRVGKWEGTPQLRIGKIPS
jgi:hypothetical protein